ncbi:MAG: cytoplasmic protein [Chitinophagales bacterium]|nr:cytoplasmic protein [Chitinophagales bacterium]
MQTFLPYDSFIRSAECLDVKRLGKQRVEVLQILNALTGTSSGWQNHPATKMWRGHEAGLSAYGIAVCTVWKKRGYKDTCLHKIQSLVSPDKNDLPSWFGDDKFHDSHKSNLLRKNPIHYSQFNWGVADDLEYYWPA